MLADEFWWLVHDDHSGEPRVSLRAAGWGLAAALLGELLYADRVRITGELVYPVWQAEPPADVLSHEVFDRVKGEPVRHPVRDWLAFLARDAYGRVADRLVRAGLVTVRASGLWPFRSERHVPVDTGVSGWPLARLAMGVRHRSPLSEDDRFLIGLAEATGLDEWLIRDATDREWARSYVGHVATTLPQQPHLLVAHLRTAVANDLVGHRT